MNYIRIRVVILADIGESSDEFKYAVQISVGGLDWFTVARLKDGNQAIEQGKALEVFVAQNKIARPTHVLWQGQHEKNINLVRTRHDHLLARKP